MARLNGTSWWFPTVADRDAIPPTLFLQVSEGYIRFGIEFGAFF